MPIDFEKEELAATLRGSVLEFMRTFFPILTGREFLVSHPIGREPHQITVCKALTRAFDLKLYNQRLLLNIPPGHGKSVMLSLWIAWCMASYPDSNFLYISYSKSVAAKHTDFIRQLMGSRHYQYLFDVHLRDDSRAKDLFKTTAGGTIGAFGSSGAITGQDGGLPNLNRFSGAVVLDDAHKPDEVHSDPVRQGVIDNYQETISQRLRGVNVPLICLGQRLHEDDLPAFFLSGKEGYEWETIILKSIDAAGNALYPENFPLKKLRIAEKHNRYVFAAQHQQEPLPAGGGLFQKSDFAILDYEPKFIQTFITVDTAETNNSWNDATVFSFWGLYEMEVGGRKINKMALHWLDCVELRIEPKHLKDAFLDFYGEASRHPVAPLMAAIEKKSTGVTLVSVLEDIRGLAIRKIERAGAANNKTQRFIDIQGFIAAKLVSFTEGARHLEGCVLHMSKITANNTHRHDDIADTCADAVRIALIDKSLYINDNKSRERKEIIATLNASLERKRRAGAIING